MLRGTWTPLILVFALLSGAQARPLALEARKLVQRQERRFDRRIMDTGFKDEKSFRSALRRHSPEARKLLEDLESERVEFAIRVAEQNRLGILDAGFLNQRVTKKSEGTLDTSLRDRVEAKLMGIGVDAYRRLPSRLKPVYGYLKPPVEAQVRRQPELGTYGTDIYVFKKDGVRARTTWTIEDSLLSEANAGLDWQGYMIPWKYRVWMAPFLIDRLPRQSGFIASFGDEDFKLAPGLRPPRGKSPDEPQYPAEPHRPFPPARSSEFANSEERLRLDADRAFERGDGYRAYRRAYDAYLSSPERARFEEAVADYQKSRAEYERSANHSRRAEEVDAYWSALPEGVGTHTVFAGTPLKSFRAGNTHQLNPYVELQFWGPMNLDLVEAFEFGRAPPRGRFLRELLKRGIKIRDGRTLPAQDWDPPAASSPGK
jgi:hypothetical protein